MKRTRCRKSWLIYAGAASTLLVMWASSGWLETPASATLATPAATPCVPVATPLATIGDCVPVGLGTPVVGDDLVVTLIAGSTKAGPVDLILVVRDAAGEAVEDATVEVRTRHIDMDHGVSTDKAVHQGDGRYLAERVSMGMGGNWEAEIVVRREGEPDVAVIFHVKLVGPTH